MFDFTVSRNLFAALEDEEGDVVAPKPVDSDAKKDWSHLPWEKESKNKKKQQQKKQETPKPNAKSVQAKPLVPPRHVPRNRPVARGRTGTSIRSDKGNGNGIAKETRVEDVSSLLTLEEYERQLQEKKSVQMQRRFSGNGVGRGGSAGQEEQAKIPEPTPSSRLNLGDSEQFPGLRRNV